MVTGFDREWKQGHGPYDTAKRSAMFGGYQATPSLANGDWGEGTI